MLWDILAVYSRGGNRERRLSIINLCEELQSALILFAKVARTQSPVPVAGKRSRCVHTGFPAQAKNILHGKQDGVRHRLHDLANKDPIYLLVELARAYTEVIVRVRIFFFYVSLGAGALRHARTPPPKHGVIVVPTGVSHKLLSIVVWTKSGGLRISTERELQN